MGELDRRAIVRRTTEVNNRLDQHAELIGAYGQTLTQHKAAIDNNHRNLQNDITALKQEIEAVNIRADVHTEDINTFKNLLSVYRLHDRLLTIESERAILHSSFWRRLVWVVRGVVSSVR